jgi:cytochrome c oxidase subunit 4
MSGETKRYVAVWIGLLILLALTCGSAFVPMGAWNNIVNLIIAVLKALLVALFFMHLKGSQGPVRICAAVALFTLGLLFLLSSGDYMTRILYAAPWQSPP